MPREVKAGPWDIENVRIPTGENPEDVVLAIKHFVKSVGCKDEFKITCFTGSRFLARRGIPLSIYRKLRATKQVDIVSWAKTRAETSIPPQAADGLLKKFINDLCDKCDKTTTGVVVLIGGDEGYKTLFHRMWKKTNLKVIWIYPFGTRTSSGLREIAKLSLFYTNTVGSLIFSYPISL